MADNYLRQNKIPGNEKLTRPEEISALSKYLKHIKEVQEEYTELNEQAVEVSGRNDSNRMVEINSLSDYLDQLESDTINLERKKLNNRELPTEREGLSENKNREVKELVDSVELLDVTAVEQLSDNVELLEVKDDSKLDDNLELLDVSEGPERLEEGYDILSDVEEPDRLEDGYSSLEDVKELDRLEDGYDILSDVKELDRLEDGYSSLEDVKEINRLEDGYDILSDVEEPDRLEDGYDILGDVEEPNRLEDTSEKVSGDIVNIKKLSTTKEIIANPKEVKELEDETQGLPKEVNTIKELSSEYAGLNAEDNAELETDAERLVGTIKNLSLSEYLDGLGGDILDLTLEDALELLKPSASDNIPLSEFIERLGGNIKDLNLVDFYEKLMGLLPDLDLENYREGFIGSLHDLTLEDFVERMGGNIQDLVLSDYQESFLGELFDLPLSEFIERLGGEFKDIPLSDFIEGFLGSIKDLSLEDFVEKMGGDLKDLDLEDYKESIFGELKDPEYPENPPIKDVNLLKDIEEKTKKALELETTEEQIKALSDLVKEAEGRITEIPLEMRPNLAASLVLTCIRDKEGKSFKIGEWQDQVISKLMYTLNELETGRNKPFDYIESAEQEFSKILVILKGNVTSSNPEDDNYDTEDNKIERKDTLESQSSWTYNTSKEISSSAKINNEILNSTENTVNEAFEDGEGTVRKYEVPLSKFPDVRNDYNNLTNSLKSNKDILSKMSDISNFADEVTDVSKYLRASVEQTIGKKSNGGTREYLVTQALHTLVYGRRLLEVSLKSNRDRLPGNNNAWLSGLLSGQGLGTTAKNILTNTAKKAVGVLTGSSSIDTTNPINRPNKEKVQHGTGYRYGTETTNFEKGNNTTTIGDALQGKSSDNSTKSIAKSILSSLVGSTKNNNLDGYNFKDNYLKGLGIETTMSELTDTDIGVIESVEDLYDALRKGTYITTPQKFGTIDGKILKNMTIDSNAYWEIIMEPYVGRENGYFSYLPSFMEMDYMNLTLHNAITMHGKWIPFTGFELSKSRMISKQVGLFDGEIAFPISPELTNELRLTIPDDAYKSWRWYFQKCMDVSVYSSRPHSKEYYKKPFTLSNIKGNGATKVDKTTPIISLYKNIAFSIKIYILTPQYSAIKMYNLLCVLRDFSEEFSGETDASAGSDLTLSFSIVGENPNEVVDISSTNTNLIVHNTLNDLVSNAKAFITQKASGLVKKKSDYDIVTGGNGDFTSTISQTGAGLKEKLQMIPNLSEKAKTTLESKMKEASKLKSKTGSILKKGYDIITGGGGDFSSTVSQTGSNLTEKLKMIPDVSQKTKDSLESKMKAAGKLKSTIGSLLKKSK